MTVFEWLDEHGSPRLVAVYCWFSNRLSGSRCFAQGCGRLMILHTPWRMRRCWRTPLAIRITEQGHAAAIVAEAERLTTEAAS